MDGLFNVICWRVPLNSETHVSSIVILYVGSSCSEKKGMAWNVFEPSTPIK
jgi:hypothetical protein